MLQWTTNSALALGLALAIGSGGWAGAKGTGEARPFCDFPGTYTEWNDFTYKVVRLVMPRDYDLMGRAWTGGRDVTGFNGTVATDDFRPMSPEEHAETTG